MSDGEQVLDILAAHPSTARFIATKLARRFVSDTPPAALVDRVAARFTATRGDLREVMRTLLTSPEFLAPDASRPRSRRRSSSSSARCARPAPTLTDARPLVRSLQQLGMPLYQCQPPTGYKDTADAWVNTGALVDRMNFALSLASAADRAAFDVRRRRADERRTPSTATAIRSSASERRARRSRGRRRRSRALALALGSPEFQRR